MNNEQKNKLTSGTEYLQIREDGSYKLADGADPLFVIGELSISYMRQRDYIKRIEVAGSDAIREAAFGLENDAWEIWNKAKDSK